MIFQNMDFHNVAQITEFEDGYLLWRFPESVRRQCSQQVQGHIGRYNTGVELRFRMLSDGVTLLLRSLPSEEAQVAHIYYGDFPGGWERSTRVIGETVTRVHIPALDNKEQLLQIGRERGQAFSPELVRVLLPYNSCVFLGYEGTVAPPQPGDFPQKTYLAYGSSITHGSLALGTPHTYAFQIAQMLRADYRNLACAGSAYAEEAMAKYIVSQKDWDFCSVELGVNMLSCLKPEEFERRIDRFTAVLAEDPRPVFATSLFVYRHEDPVRGELYRRIVEKYAQPRLLFTDGLALLGDPALLSQDLVHPCGAGHVQIAHRWAKIMQEQMGCGK